MKTELQKYPAYKHSGVEWLGEIPKSWEILPSKRFHQVKKQPNSKKQCDNVLSLTLRGVVNNDPDSPEGMVPKDYGTYQIFEKENLVFKLIDLENVKTSRVGIVHEKGIMSSAYIRLIIGDDNFSRFAYYYYYCLYINQVYNNLGSGVRSTLGPTDLLNIPYLKPTPLEQTAIATFLDRKTALIDQAIGIKQKQIELLKERKQILIHKAVTRGLNYDLKDEMNTMIGKDSKNQSQSKNQKNHSSRPMKDSGVEWIGEIPEGWEVKRLKYVLEINNGSDYKHIQVDNGYPVIGSGGQFAFASEFMYNGEVVLLGRKGTIDKPLYFNGKFWAVDTMFYGIPKNRNNCKFLFYASTIIPFKFYSTATALPSMTQSDLNNHKIAVPPISEQNEIVSYIEIATAKIATAITIKEQEIEKLKEYKATLINSAVTGKIKVC